MNQQTTTTPIKMIASGSEMEPQPPNTQIPPLSPGGFTGEESFYMVQGEFSPSASMHGHHTNTNGWSPADAPSSITEAPEDGMRLPDAEGCTDNSSTTLASSASQLASSATSQWGEDSATVPKTPTADVLPTGVPRGLAPSECRGGTKLTHSGSKSCHTPRGGPPPSVCTKGQPLSESLSSSIAICYDNDWVWFAMGAIAVAGAMFAGNRFYTTMQGRAEGKARCVSTRAMMT